MPRGEVVVARVSASRRPEQRGRILHERLYGVDNLRSIEARDYLDGIVQESARAHGDDRGIAIESLVTSLVQQIDGQVSSESGAGVRWTISFPKPRLDVEGGRS